MADRILTWSMKTYPGGTAMMLPSYYMESEYDVKAVRIHAGTPSNSGDIVVDIFADGVSIMADHDYSYADYIANTATYSGETTIRMYEGDTSDEMAEDFNYTPIPAGSWVTCVMTSGGTAKDITVILELDKLSDGDEDTD